MTMDTSPAGRWVTTLDGEPAEIRKRGNQITSLGNQMQDGSTFLKGLVDQASDQRGKAIEKLREVVGDTYDKLGQAGDLYRPTGPVLVTYADALAEVQPKVNAAYERCVELWQEYQNAPGYLEGDRPFWDKPDDESPEAEDASTDDANKQGKLDDYVAEARIWDGHVDTWEEAFDAAATGIGDAMAGKIKDGFWDNVDGFVGGVLKVLQVVGIIIAIAAIIIGGPIVALIGAVVGVLTLALTAYQYIRGDTGLTQLIFAVIGVIPIGSLGKLFQGGAGRLAFLGEMVTAFKPSSWSAAISQGRSLSLLGGLAGGGWRGFSAMSRGLFSMNNPNGVGDVMMRLMFGKSVSGMEDTITAMTGATNGYCRSTTIAAGWEFAHGMLSGPWKMVNNIATWTGHGDQSPGSKLPWVGAAL
nr:hypothetical protein [Microbacterium bovistercoris]